MRREHSLLERVSAAGSEDDPQRYHPSAEEDAEALMESVQRNLGRLLNSRHGMSEAAEDYGLPALNDLVTGGEEYVRRVQEAIRVAIEKYEPRLRRVRVTHQTEQSDPRKLVFRVDATLVGRSGEHRVWYQTAFSPAGRFQVVG